jgi:hypothetical protein
MRNLAEIWKKLDRYQDAIGLMQEVVQRSRSIFGSEHSKTVGFVERLERWKSEVGTLESSKVDKQPPVFHSQGEQKGESSGQRDSMNSGVPIITHFFEWFLC